MICIAATMASASGIEEHRLGDDWRSPSNRLRGDALALTRANDANARLATRAVRTFTPNLQHRSRAQTAASFESFTGIGNCQRAARETFFSARAPSKATLSGAALSLGETELYDAYHETPSGCALHDDERLFEFLVLEGAQAGLSWITFSEAGKLSRKRLRISCRRSGAYGRVISLGY